MSQDGTSHTRPRNGQLFSHKTPAETRRMYHFVMGSGTKNCVGLTLTLVPKPWVGSSVSHESRKHTKGEAGPRRREWNRNTEKPHGPGKEVISIPDSCLLEVLSKSRVYCKTMRDNVMGREGPPILNLGPSLSMTFPNVVLQ